MTQDASCQPFKCRLKDIYVQEWYRGVTESSKARPFVHMCESFGYKMYLNTLNVAKYRIALTRLRMSSHRLGIETGRWHKPKAIELSERKCTSCDILEDEFHVGVIIRRATSN